MKFCKLEIVLHSGKSLNDVKIFGTMDPYVVVWISGGGKETKALKTEVAKRGGSFPVWNYSMDFNISSMNNSYTLFCEIKHDGHIVDRNIGEVQIPFKDLLAGDASGKNVSYPVKIWSGEVKGEIILSHKFSQPKVKENDSSGKVADRPKKKGDQKKKKKKNGTMKPIGKRVVTQVASEAILLAGTAGLIVALDDGSSMSAAVDVEFNDEDQDQDQDEDEDDQEEEDEDQDEDEDEDQDEGDEDEDEDQDDEDEDEDEDDDDDDDYDDDD